MASPRKILTVFYKHRRGGHCKRLYLMVEALLDAGFEVHYVAAKPLRLKPHKNLVPHILRLPVKSFKGFWFWTCFTCVTPFVLIHLAVVKRVSLIAVFDTYYSLLAKPAALIARVPLLLFLRAVPWRVNQMVIGSILQRAVTAVIDFLGLEFAKKIVAVTTTMQEEIAGKLPLCRKRIITLPNSVLYPPEIVLSNEGTVERDKWDAWLSQFVQRKKQIADEFAFPEKSVLLCTTGELTSRKNVEHLVRAIGANGNEKLCLIICGDGPEQVKIASVISGYGLRSQVVLAGWVENAVRIVAGCDLFVMTSRHEGMSNSMLEALGTATAVIAADTPEMREVLDYDDLLFNPTHVGELAEKLEALATKKGEIQRIRELSHERARHFAFNWGREVVSLIEQQMI